MDFRASPGENLGRLSQRLLVGRTDIRPIFERMDRKGARVLALFDACYSGNTIRAAKLASDASRHPRRIELAGILNPQPGIFRRALFRERPTQPDPADRYPYQNVVYLAAASENQPAQDIGLPEARTHTDGKPHGAFTEALLRVLRGELAADANGDGELSPAELLAVIGPLVSQNYGQTPQLLPSVQDDFQNHQIQGFFKLAKPEALPSTAPITSPVLRVQVEGHFLTLTAGLEQIPGVTLSTNGADLTVTRRNTDVWFVLSNGHPLARYSNPDEKALLEALKQQVHAWPLRTIHHPASGIQIQVERGGSGADGVAMESN